LSWQRLKGWDPNWTALDSRMVRAVTQAAAAVRGERGGSAPVVRLPASDAARWRARGAPAVCFGPQATLASGVDDAVEEQDVVDCVAIYALAALQVLGSDV
jgi:succinyl-diaminopimelate desuccinylase